MSTVYTPPTAPTAPTFGNVWRNLRDLPGSITIASLTAGFIVALIGYTGPILIVLQAAEAAGLTPEQTASWVWAVAVGNGVYTMILCLLFRQPIIAPWSTAGAALLVNSLPGVVYSDAIGAYIFASLAVALVGVSGLFGRIMALVPAPVVMGVLAGVLLQFGLNLFARLPENPAIVVAMILIFFLLKRARFRAPTLGALIVGAVIAAVQGQVRFEGVTLAVTVPVFTAPTLNATMLLTLGLPLFALALTSQYAPGLAVLRSGGYAPPINRILALTGLGSALLAPFGNQGNTLGALTAAIVVSGDSEPDRTRRYAGAFVSGVFYTLFGVFGTTSVALFRGFPPVFVSAIAGLSLSGVIASSLAGALERSENRDAAIVAFLCTAGGFTLFGIGAPFWGLIAGVTIHVITRRNTVQ